MTAPAHESDSAPVPAKPARRATVIICACFFLRAFLMNAPDANAQNRPQPADKTQTPPVKIQSDRIDVDGCQVHVLTAGPEAGQIVLLLHGAAFKAQTWRDNGILERLAREGKRVIAIDLPGFGDSPRCKTPADRFLEALIPKLCPRKPVIVSPSMSGAFSLPFLIAHPDRAAGFVAVAPVAIKAHADKLDRIITPTLAIWGANDTVVPRANAEILVKKVKHAELVVIPDARHPCYMDKPDAFTDRLLEFLADIQKDRKPKPAPLTNPTEPRP